MPKGGPFMQGTCKTSDYKVEGNKVSWAMTCEKMTGTSELLYAGETYTGAMKMKMDDQEVTMKLSGKRLGDCTR